LLSAAENYPNDLTFDFETGNFRVNPYYPSSGGSVIDWMPVEFGDND